MTDEERHKKKYSHDVLKKDIREKILAGKFAADIRDWAIEKTGLSQVRVEHIISEVKKELRDFYKKDKETFQEDFHNKYLYLYEKLIAEKNYKEARAVLDSHLKITGLLNQDVNVNLGENATVTVSFGIKKENNEEQ